MGEVDSCSERAMREFVELVEPRSLPSFTGTIGSAHNSIGVLVHWKVVVVLMLTFWNPEVAMKFRDDHSLSPEEEQELKATLAIQAREACPHGVDGHFHLDRTIETLYGSFPHHEASLDTLCLKSPPDETFKVLLDEGVANFCDPQNFDSLTDDFLSELSERGLWITVGLHPKHSHLGTPDNIARIQLLLDNPKVSGLGEIGLDFGDKPGRIKCQLKALDKLLPLVKGKDKVLVLHCRGATKGAGVQTEPAVRMLLWALRTHCDSQQRIHFHCYSGDFALAQEWLGHFPNTMFGFTIMPTTRDMGAFAALDSARLILETDSPYFQFPQYPGKLSNYTTPFHIGMVASNLAEIRGMYWVELLDTCSANVRRLYSPTARN